MMYTRKPIQENNIVFLGDSLTEGFDLEKYFQDDNLINRGISGDMTQHVLYRLEEITNAEPQKIFLMIGINDLFQGLTERDLLHNYEKIITEIVTHCPKTKLFIQSILPVNEEFLLMEENLNTKIYKANNALRKLSKIFNLEYIDIHADFLNEQGQMASRFTFDGAHLSEKGYQLWARLIEEYLI